MRGNRLNERDVYGIALLIVNLLYLMSLMLQTNTR